MIEYREFPASCAVSEYVECFWTVAGRADAAAPPDRILPDGRAELVWNFADPFIRYDAGAVPRRQATGLLVGQITGPLLLQPTGAIDLLGVRFRPSALGPFLSGMPAAEVTELDLPLEDVFGSRFDGVRDAAATATSAGARVAVVEAGLRDALRHARPVDRRLEAAVHLLEATHGTRRIDNIAADVGVSPRQLERLFLAGTGLGPKRFARILRFRRLIALLGTAPSAAGHWARIAQRCGYFDQAHLIRDFREFTGDTPGEFTDSAGRPMMAAFLSGI